MSVIRGASCVWSCLRLRLFQFQFSTISRFVSVLVYQLILEANLSLDIHINTTPRS